MRLIIGLLAAVVGCQGALLAQRQHQVARSIETAREALSVADAWRKTSEHWEANAKLAEQVATKWETISARCTSGR